MNRLSGTISKIQKSGAIMLVDIDIYGHGFSALLIESNDSPHCLQTGNSIDIVFKETEVSLAKNLSGLISMRNRMMCKVKNIVHGTILSTIEMQFHCYSITSAITTRAAEALNIRVGDEVEALVKSNEISLASVNSYQLPVISKTIATGN